MWFRSLFDSLLARSTGTPARRRGHGPQARPRPLRFRPLLDILEDRTLPSTYTVNTLTDTGTGSGLTGDLRYCVTHAVSGSDTITFGVTGTIALKSALPALNASVTIQGPGPNQLTVQGGAYYYSPFYFGNLFTVGSGANVRISGLTIDDALTAIDNAGSLVINNSALLNCTDWDGFGYAGYGAALSNTGSATISNSTVEGNYSRRGAVNNGGTLTISNSTLSLNQWGPAISTGGTAIISDSTLSGNSDSGGYGGAILNAGNLTVNCSTLSGNRSENLTYGGYGGAIYNNGTLTVNNSTLSGNKAVGGAAYTSTTTAGSVNSYPASSGIGGGIYLSSGTLSINSSTLEGNQAAGGSTAGLGGPAGDGIGGGLYVYGGTVSINNSTLADNQAIAGSGSLTGPGTASGGGISSNVYNSAGAGALQLYDTILADNTAATAPDLDGSFTSLGHNLIGDTNGGNGFVASDLLNVNPQLGPLQNNGGPTQTMALLPGSPAIDAGGNTNAPTYDQRGPGFPRIVNGTIDIGAFEVQSGTSTQASSLAVTGFPSSITAGVAGSFTVTVQNADGTTDTNYTGTVHFTSSDGQAVLPADYVFTAADAGRHTFSATLKTAGTQSITATDATTASVTGTDGGLTVNPAAASKFILTAPVSVSAGTAFSLTLTVEDAYGNVVTGYSGTVHFSSTDTKATLPKNYTFTAADKGVHTFTGLVLRKKGNQRISLTDMHNSALTGSVLVDVL